VAITGDICDYARCVDWIPATLAKLKSRFGKYGNPGNHDRRIRTCAVARALTSAGL